MSFTAEQLAARIPASENRAPQAKRRRRWWRLSRNLLLAAAVYLVLSQTLLKKPGVQVVPYETWTKELAAHRGDVVVVPVWASWCRNCVEMLPSLVKMSQMYEERGVSFVSLCLDENSEDGKKAAREIVRRRDLRFSNFLLEQDIGASLDALGVADVPAVLVYSQTGELRHTLEADRWSDEVSMEDVRGAIESLLSAD